MIRRALPGMALLSGLVMMGVYPGASFAQAASAPPAATLAALNAQGQQECLQPPATWNVAALTDEQLALYGLPTHTIMAADASEWAQMLTHYKHRSCGTHALPTGMTVKDLSPVKPAVSGSVSNWAGNYAYGSRGQFQQILGNFTLPDATATSGPVGALAAFWAGLGGVQTSLPNGTYPVELIQAGIATTIENTYLYNWAWYEAWNPVCGNPKDLTCPMIPLNLPDMYPGDTFSVNVTSNLANSNINTYMVCNDTWSTCNSAPENGSYTETDLSDSNDAECIGEEPGSAMVFGTEDVSGCYTVEKGNSNQAYAVGAINHDYAYIDNSSVYVGVDATFDGGASWDLPSSWN